MLNSFPLMLSRGGIQGRVPGRDAYPADVFNVHGSLLERCGKTK
jgi:F0F1-type ATP synthase alpha subunit